MVNVLSIIEKGATMLYIDPAATSVLLSSITAIVIAVGASAIIIWRKLKKKVSKTFHIDPNAGKEVEEDLVVSDEEVNNETKQETETKEEESKLIEENQVDVLDSQDKKEEN